MADVKDGVYTDPVSGKEVIARGGKAVLEHAGKLYEVDPQEMGAKILAEGFRPATAADLAQHAAEKKHGGAAGALKAFGEHAATGLYGGVTAIPRALGGVAEVIGKAAGVPSIAQGPGVSALSEEALAKGVAGGIGGIQAGEEYAQARAERAAVHPAAALGGELLGQTVGAGGSALGSAAAASKGAGLAAKVAAGSLEGAGFGGSAAAEQAYIEHTDLTAEKLVSSMGPMALLGGGAALLGAGASRLFQRSGSRGEAILDSPVLTTEAEAGPKGFWQRLSNEQVVKSTQARPSQLKRIGRTQEQVDAMTQKMGDEVKATRLRDGRRLFPETEWEAAKMSQEDFASRLKLGAEEAGDNLGKFRERVWKQASESNAYRSKPVFDMERFAKEADEQIVAPLRKGVFSESKAEAGLMSSKLDAIKSLGENPSLQELDAARRELRSIFQPPKPAGGGLPAQPPIGAANYEKLERLLERHIEVATDKVAAAMPGGKAGEYLALKSKFHTINTLAGLSEGAMAAERGLNTFSLTEKMAGGVGAVAGALGSGGLASAAGGLATMTAAKMLRERGSAVLAVLAERLSKNVDTRIDGAIGKLLSKAELPAAGQAGGKAARVAKTAGLAAFAKSDEDPREAFVRHARDVYAAQQPAQATAKLAKSFEPLYSHAPQLAQAATAATQRANSYLASKIPSGAVSVNIFSPAKYETAISDEDLHKFATAWNTVNNPLAILDDIRDNMLTVEQVEAVKVVYPELFQQIQLKVREQLTKLKEPPPYSTRLQLDLLLDLNGAGEPSMTPQFQRTLANISQMQMQQQAQAQPRPPVAPSAKASQYRSLSGGIAAGEQ